MCLSRFIEENLEEILQAWESFARGLVPATEGMTDLALRDHAPQILQAIACDIETNQTPEEQFSKSMGLDLDAERGHSAGALHGTLRHESNFSMSQVTAEYRALRATVLRLWLPRVTNPHEALNEMVRFNEAMDEALAESVFAFAARTVKARDMFLAILGHDLRAPLTTLTLTGHALRRPTLEPERVDELGLRVTNCASLMTSMVEDLAYFAVRDIGGLDPTTLVARRRSEVAASLQANPNVIHQVSIETMAQAPGAVPLPTSASRRRSTTR